MHGQRLDTITPIFRRWRWHRESAKSKGSTFRKSASTRGVPSSDEDPYWHYFWSCKLRDMIRRGINIFSRELRYRNKTIRLRVRIT